MEAEQGLGDTQETQFEQRMAATAAPLTFSLAATPDRICTIAEAATQAKVSRRTIYNWMAQGKLTIYRTPGGMVRLLTAELLTLEPAEVTK